MAKNHRDEHSPLLLLATCFTWPSVNESASVSSFEAVARAFFALAPTVIIDVGRLASTVGNDGRKLDGSRRGF